MAATDDHGRVAGNGSAGVLTDGLITTMGAAAKRSGTRAAADA